MHCNAMMLNILPCHPYMYLQDDCVGHVSGMLTPRSAAAKPEILKKYERHLQGHFDERRIEELVELGQDREKLEGMGADRYMDLYTKEKMDW